MDASTAITSVYLSINQTPAIIVYLLSLVLNTLSWADVLLTEWAEIKEKLQPVSQPKQLYQLGVSASGSVPSIVDGNHWFAQKEQQTL